MPIKIKEILIKLEIFFSCAIFMKNSNIIDSIDQYKCPHNDEERVKILDIYIYKDTEHQHRRLQQLQLILN